MTIEKSDRDLLVETYTLVKVNHEQFSKHLEDCAVKFGTIEAKTTAAHRRIDWLLIAGVLTVVLFVGSMLYATNGK